MESHGSTGDYFIFCLHTISNFIFTLSLLGHSLHNAHECCYMVNEQNQKCGLGNLNTGHCNKPESGRGHHNKTNKLLETSIGMNREPERTNTVNCQNTKPLNRPTARVGLALLVIDWRLVLIECVLYSILYCIMNTY